MSGALSVDAVIGVVGAGRMGTGIAMVAAAAGSKVLLFDVDSAAVTRALRESRAELDKLVGKGRLSCEEAAARMARIRPTGTLGELSQTGLVIEAIAETLPAKRALFTGLETVVSHDAILATNTSSLSVTAIAATLKNPGRLAGLHFFNPATLMPLVEIVSGAATRTDVADTLFETAKAWGKLPVHSRSTPGFIVNRVARPFYAEALRLLTEHAASVQTLDAIFRECGGFRMGPFELMDMIGHDVNFAVSSSVYEAFFQDPRYRPSLIQKELVDAGRLGRKSGQGFYSYAPDAPVTAAATAPLGLVPGRLVIEGDLGPASALAELAVETGLPVKTTDGLGIIRCGETQLALTDGRTAVARSAEAGAPIILFDLSFDYRAMSRIALAAPPGTPAHDLDTACGLFQAFGKAVSVVDDVAGLAVMRTVAMLANEAADALLQGVSTAENIDLAMLKGASYPRGPLAWCDQVGARRLVHVLDRLNETYPEGRYRASPLLRRHALTGTPLTPAAESRHDQD
jgi:3-hydroxybutyryl-CoA dehydrogenase